MSAAAALPALPQDIAYSYKVKGSQCHIQGIVTNGGVNQTKAFVAIVSLYTKDDVLIDGPYQGLSFSKLGAYYYIQGGSIAAPYRLTFKVALPQDAAKLVVRFAPWDCEDNIQLDGLPHIKLFRAVK